MPYINKSESKSHYEVQQVDEYDEVMSSDTFTNYEKALDCYHSIEGEGGFCRLLFVNDDGEPLKEILANY